MSHLRGIDQPQRAHALTDVGRGRPVLPERLAGRITTCFFQDAALGVRECPGVRPDPT